MHELRMIRYLLMSLYYECHSKWLIYWNHRHLSRSERREIYQWYQRAAQIQFNFRKTFRQDRRTSEE